MQFNSLRADLHSFIHSFDANIDNSYHSMNECQQYWDQKWINEWISCRTNKSDANSQLNAIRKRVTNNININEFSLELKSTMNLLSIYNQKYKTLYENMDNLDNNKWDSIICEMNVFRKQIEAKLWTIREKVVLIKAKLHKIKRKRNAMRRQRSVHKKLCAESVRKRNQLIDQWFDGKHVFKDRIKRENDMKKEADIVLIEIRNKINDSKKCMKRLNALEKARNVRKSCAQTKSKFTSSESDSLFMTKMSEMKALMKEKLAIYRKQENAIKSMVKNEYEKPFNESQKSQTEFMFNDLNQKQLDIFESLFGCNQFPEANNLRSLKNWQFYEQSHHNIDNMIKIRHLWDKHLNLSEGSPIPKSYIWPISPSNTLWNKYLKN